ncbi:MAG: autoinducer binding domain-containing protein [Paracoccaceae bacterium]
MSTRLNTILERLQTLPSLGGFGAIIDVVRGTYDVDHVTYYAVSLGIDARELEKPEVQEFQDIDGVILQTGRKVAAVSYPQEWLRWYVEANFFESDPVLLGASASFDPVDWGELSWESRDEREFRVQAQEFGVGNQGYTVPVRGPGGQLALFTINKQCSQDTWQAFLAEHRTDFMLLGHFMHQRVLRLVGADQPTSARPLSAREKDAMRLIAKGMSRGRASEQLGISENTFRVYIDSARHKLGALNIPNAIALAVHRGIIPPV